MVNRNRFRRLPPWGVELLSIAVLVVVGVIVALTVFAGHPGAYRYPLFFGSFVALSSSFGRATRRDAREKQWKGTMLGDGTGRDQ
jgi:hypothetical protein